VGIGAGPGVGLVGVGVGLGLVGVGDDEIGVVEVGLGAGLVPVGLGVGDVPVGLGVGLVEVGVGVGEVPVGLGVGDVLVGVGVGEVPVGVGVGVVLVGVGVGVVRVGVGVGLVLVGVGVGVVTVGVGVGVAPVGVGVGVVGVGVGVGGGVAQVGAVIVSVSRLTCPLRASTRPATVSPVVTEIDVSARTVPMKEEWVPRVAELPTCQNTLQAWAPLIRRMLLAESVVRLEGAWKMKTAFGSPPPFRVSLPWTSSVEDALYTPATSAGPPLPIMDGMLAVGLRPAASLYAVVRSSWACPATASALWMAPFTMPGGNPVTAVPGLTPRSPLMTLGPVLVTVCPARTAKLPAVPRPTGAVAATAGWAATNTAMAPAAATGPAASQAKPARRRGARLPISDIC
jgi:hypothetical protein